MNEPAVKLINFGSNTSNVDNLLVGNNSIPERSPFEDSSLLIGDKISLSGTSNTFSNTLPGNGINPFAGDAGSQLQQLIFARLRLVLGDNFLSSANLFTSVTPISSEGSLPFDPLKLILGDSIPFSSTNNPSTGSPPFNQNNAPIGNGNQNSGNNNATIGNFNSNFGSETATIGNGNWNFNNNNTTIGNGNWLFASDNITLGNGNWYWDNGSHNATLGNGNWHFGADNATIGNGNWDFGSNNTIIGNGNWIFTSGNTIIGNGNWLADSESTIIDNGNNTSSLELFPQQAKADVANLINYLVGRVGQDFVGLTGNFGVSDTQTFNRLILAQGTDTNNNISTEIERLLGLFSEIPGNAIAYPPMHNPQPVPESNLSIPLIVAGVVYLLSSKLKKRIAR